MTDWTKFYKVGIGIELDKHCETPGLNTIGSAFVKTLISQHCGKILGNKVMK